MFQEMAANGSWLDCTSEYILLFIAYGLLVIPSITCQRCRYVPLLSTSTYRSDPVIEISSTPSSNKLPIGASLNLTCIAKQNDKLSNTSVWARPYSIQWFNPQGKLAVGGQCQDESPADPIMTCTLVVGPLTLGKFGTYTCKASNERRCIYKKIEVNYHDIQTPGIAEVPVNQTAAIGSKVIFNCTLTGHPKPAITWTKDNDSHSVQSNPRAKVVTDDDKSHSQLVITGVTSEDYGKYQCVGNNSAGVEISSVAFLYPETLEIVEVPVNQTAAIGSKVIFNCTVTGHPKPAITWTKDNDSHSVQSNPRAKVVTDHDMSHSQLVITGVTSEDYGKYWCVAMNSAGVKVSSVVFLYPGAVVSNPSRSVKPLKARGSDLKIIAIIVPSVIIVVMVICGVSGILWYCRRRRARETYRTHDPEISMTSITCTDSVDRISLPCEANNIQEETENTYDFIDGSVPSIPESLKLQLPGVEIDSEENPLLGKLRVDIPATCRKPPRARLLSPTPDLEDTPPERPPKPRRKESTEPRVICSCMLQSKKSDTLNSKDSGYDSAESRDSICIDQEMTCILDSERKSYHISQKFLEEIEEGWEIDMERLNILREDVLGEGEFGVVYKGHYREEDGKTIDVAVKQLRDTTSVTNKADLLSEIQILKQAGRHPNIVNLVGACTQHENILVVTELIPGGSLESLLKSKRGPGEWNKYENLNCELNDRELLIIAQQIASGMQHLEERKCIHRDLAARNVFIDANKVAKVGDFGMARDISDDGIYTKTSSGKVPWRWSSLESLRDRVYTSQSDVWSFGIVLWEITTYGEVPYPAITTPVALINFLSSGKRMPRPDHCSEELYTLMSSCWMENILARPTFAFITKQMEYFLREFKRTYVNIKDDGVSSDVEA